MSLTKILPDFLKGSTETLGRAETTKTQHRVLSLFPAAVILLDPSIQVGAAAVFHFGTKDLADRARIQIVAITGWLARNANTRAVERRERLTQHAEFLLSSCSLNLLRPRCSSTARINRGTER